MTTHHKIVIGDSRQMKEIPDESAHLVITSPPYWQLKDYWDGQQIGYNDTYEEYVNNLNLVWNECQRVLYRGCRLCVNIGDQFARAVYYGRYKVIPIRTEVIRFCESVGLDYMGAIIWQKVTTTHTTGRATVMGSYPFPRNGILKLDYEFILIFKKCGAAPKVSKEIKDRSKLTREEWDQYFTGHWNFPGVKQDKHAAMFSLELPTRLIRMFSFVGVSQKKTTSVDASLDLIEQEGDGDGDRSGSGQGIKEAMKRLPYLFEDRVKIDRKVDRSQQKPANLPT